MPPLSESNQQQKVTVVEIITDIMLRADYRFLFVLCSAQFLYDSYDSCLFRELKQ